MRADRLITLLMLLQTRGQMTASALAQELEVSERTIYRDIVALSSAGIPVYAETGRQGGYALVDHYRTSLTGLTDGEVRTLFMLSIPEPLAQLGLGQELKSALLKLSAALPSTRRSEEERTRQRFYLDSESRPGAGEEAPHLQVLQQAVWQDRLVQLTYSPVPNLVMEQAIEAYGLVASAGGWYLVWRRKGQMRALRLSAILDARLADENFQRLTDFDLVEFWKGWRQDRQASYPVHLRVAPQFAPRLTAYLGQAGRAALAQAAPADAQGWVTIELSFASLEAARSRLLAFGGAVEVLAPRALRLSVQDYARQILRRYQPD